MDILNSILQYLLLPATIIGILGYFGKQIIDNYLTKRLEVYKSELDKSSYEYQIRFTKLHEKRIIIIEELYHKLIQLGNSLKSFNGSKSEGKFDELKLKDIWEKWLTISEFFTKNDIYFSKDISKKIDFLISFVKDLLISFSFQLADKTMHLDLQKRGEIDKEDEDEYNEIFSEHKKDDDYFVNTYIPDIESQLKDEFRKLIGAE